MLPVPIASLMGAVSLKTPGLASDPNEVLNLTIHLRAPGSMFTGVLGSTDSLRSPHAGWDCVLRGDCLDPAVSLRALGCSAVSNKECWLRLCL